VLVKRLRLPSPALVVAVIAVVLALGGVAFAATGQLVNIVDPTNSANAAKVTSGGELRVASRSQAAPAATPLRFVGSIVAGLTPVFGPTTATLGIDHLTFRNPRANVSQSNATMIVQLFKLSVSGGVCTNNATAILADYNAMPGETVIDDWTAPISVKSTGGQPYCIGATLQGDGQALTSYTLPVLVVQGQVISGTYTGPGTTAASEGTVPVGQAPFQEAGQPRPAGATEPIG
jgi:hypothetical protein